MNSHRLLTVALSLLLTTVAALALTPPAALTCIYDVPTAAPILRWQPASGATGYRVFAATAFEGPFTLLAVVTGPEHVDTEALAVRRFYRVVADSAETESLPSNTIGYVKIHGIFSHTAFGLPFVFWDVPAGIVPTYGVESRKPSDILGSQTWASYSLMADRIVEQDGQGRYAWRNSNAGGAWTGTLETAPAAMAPGKAYFYTNWTGFTRTLVLAGDADTTAVGIPAVPIAAPTNPATANSVPYSWRDPRVIHRSTLNLLESGFRGGTVTTSDRVYEQGGNGRSFYFLTNGMVWAGMLTSVTPGHAYWIVNKHVGLPGWNYTYTPAGGPPAP